MYKLYGKFLFHEMRTQRRHRRKSLAEKPVQKERRFLNVILILVAAGELSGQMNIRVTGMISAVGVEERRSIYLTIREVPVASGV
jgi:hypothetical protein